MLRIKVFLRFIILMMLLLIAGCGGSSDDPSPSQQINLVFQFQTDAEGWMGDFADYPAGKEDDYELIFSHAGLPAPLNSQEGALMLSGNNHSDDLFMFLKKRITGLEPNRSYAITFTIEFASNVADGMTGIGGSPGEGVLIKAGASSMEPNKILDTTGRYRMNIDKGNQNNGGRDMIVVGDFSNDTGKNVYTLKTAMNETPFHVQTDDQGELWLSVGTDSGFEGKTTIYFNTISCEIVMDSE